MLPRELITAALNNTADLLESGYAAEVTRRENRLCRAFAASLEEHEQVVEAKISPEWRPEMPFWPWSTDGKKKLGGFDCAIRFAGDDSYSLVVELKWSHYGYVNALDEAIWDALKLAHAEATLPGVTHGVLVYLAPLKAWNTPARFAELFEDCFLSTLSLINEHESIWRWCLREGSAARPTKMPPYLQTGPLASAGLMVHDAPWELRAAVVRANGEPWIDLDADGMPPDEKTPVVFDWPYPEPGRGMVADDPALEFRWPTYEIEDIRSDLLDPSAVPPPHATWSEICFFAAHFNGYEHYGDIGLAETANAARAHFDDYLAIDPALNLDKLRGCLFYEHRRYHHFGHAPGADDTPYIRALIDAIRDATAFQQEPPAS